MRASVGGCLLALAVVSAVPAASLDEARLRWLKGNYEEAQAGFEELVKDAKLLVPASIGLSRALQSQGEYDRALTVVEAALKARPKEADLLARQGELLHLRGRWDEALASADAALALRERQLLARWVRAQVLRDRGDLKEADAEVKRIVRLYSDVVNTANEIKDPEDLVVVGLASAENARWNGLDDEFQAILEDLYGDAIKFNKAYWPAELQAGLLLLEKYNRGEALDALDKALTINPGASEALAAKGAAALLRFEYKDAERLAEQALKFNPRLPEALRLRADVYLGTNDPAAALKELQLARQVNPRDERTLARVAVCHLLRGQKAEYDALVAAVEKANRKPATFYLELADRLEERRRYDLAERAYQQAAKLRPELAGPLNGLGLLYMRLGKEAEATATLEKAFKADRFNVRVSNMRKVLKHLAGYQELRTKHFRVRYDAKADPVLARLMADSLERIYEELAERFAYRPEGPILVELFRSHDMFSGRTVALPDLHTIGACTGKVVTLVSPNEKTARGEPARKPFNWARVLRHEVVHIFNLAQTGYLVPHWFTEGLAVSNEGFPRPPSWNKMLLERVPAGRLLDLDRIDLAFIRPRDPLEWQQAYCQAQLYVEYLEKQYGTKAIGALLAAFAEGKTTAEAIRIVCKTDQAAFEKGYRGYLDEVVAGLRGKQPEPKRRTLDELRAEYKKDPRNADVAAELALRVLPTQRAEARRLAEEAVERQRNHPKALYVLALLARRAADSKMERTYLERALDRDAPEPLVLEALGKMYYDASEHSRAAELFELGRKLQPQERSWLVELARVYARLEQPAKQIGVLRDLVPLDADDLDRRVRLARLLLEQGSHAEAEQAARQALEIDVTSKEAIDTLFKALKGQKKADELRRMEGLLQGKGS